MDKTKINGTMYILVSAICFGTYGVWSKMMSGIFDEFFQSWTRSLIIILILIPIGIYTKSFIKLDMKDLKWFLIYSIPGAMVVPTMYYAFTTLSIGTTTLLFYSALTISTYVYGAIFFNEKMNKVKIFSLLLGIAGLSVMYTLNFRGSLFPMIIATISGICGGTEVVFTKKLSDKYSPIQLTSFLYGVCFVIMLSVFLVINNFSFKVEGTWIAWLADFGHAITSLFAFLLVVKGYNYLEASMAGIIGLLEIPIGIIFALIIFKEPITTSIMFGGILIIFACILPNLVDVIKKRKEVKVYEDN